MFSRRIRPALSVCSLLAVSSLPSLLQAATTTIPNSGLIPSTSLYTNNFGDVVVTTDGGNDPGIGDPSGRNDDGFRGPVDLGFTLNFFGTNYTQFYINNNGNVSFGNGVAAFTPTGPTGISQPVISPFFADADSRGANSGVVHLSQSANQTIVTWDHMGYFDSHDDKLNTFQLVLRGSNYNVPAGEGQIGFFYTTMQWETGDASDGANGFGGTPAAVGFGDGQGNAQILQGSTKNGIASLVNNEHIWFGLDNTGVPETPGTPETPETPTPEPGSISLLMAGIGGLMLASRKLRANR